MSHNAGFGFPRAELLRVDFLIGESSGVSTLVAPEGLPVQFRSYLNVSREACERFLRLEYYGEIPNLGIESIHALLTYSVRHEAYQMWCFAASQEAPLVLTGNFEGETLVLLSEPADMIWGLQKMRLKYRPLTDGIVECVAELWTIDGFVPFYFATFSAQSANVA